MTRIFLCLVGHKVITRVIEPTEYEIPKQERQCGEPQSRFHPGDRLFHGMLMQLCLRGQPGNGKNFSLCQGAVVSKTI